MHAARLGRRAPRMRLAVLAGEDRDQPAVAGIEIDVALERVVEIGLLEDEGHAEQALPEVDRGLAVRADQRDVMQALGLKLFHRRSFHGFSTAWTCTRCAASCPAGVSVDFGRHDELVAQPRANALGESPRSPRRARSRPRSAAAGPAARPRARPDQQHAGDVGREFVDDLAHRRGKHVDAAHDQHVVGAPDAAHARRGAPAGAATDAEPARDRGCGSAAAASSG